MLFDQVAVGRASHEGVAAVRHNALQIGFDRATVAESTALLLLCFHSRLRSRVQGFRSPYNFTMVAFHRLPAEVRLSCNAACTTTADGSQHICAT